MAYTVRQAEANDEVAPLLRAASPELYDLYFGGRARALRALTRLARREGHLVGWEVSLIASAGSEEVVGVLTGFPHEQYEARNRRFHQLALGRMPPWRWRGPWLTLRFDPAADLGAPAGAWYVDTLAVAHSHRRRGVARALMIEAESRARAAGAASIALYTAESNRTARAFYESCGMTVRGRASLPPGARALGVSVTGWLAYAKAL